MVRRTVLVMVVIIGTLLLGACAGQVKFEGIVSETDERPLTLTGTLMKPKGDGPFPAVIVLHGCGGVRQSHIDWASKLKTWGYVALVVDSLGPRNVSNICAKGWDVDPYTRAMDAHKAKSYLAELPFVDQGRIGVLGFSHGGASALVTIHRSSFKKQAPFQVAIAFYPACSFLADTEAPLLILIGEKDDWVYASFCEKWVEKLGDTEYEVILKVYPGAYHGFDNPRRGRWYRGHYLEYNQKAASDAKIRVREFLAKHLK
jgi:dienelactone hydrolase